MAEEKSDGKTTCWPLKLPLGDGICNFHPHFTEQRKSLSKPIVSSMGSKILPKESPDELS